MLMLFRWLSLLFWYHIVVSQVLFQLNDSCDSHFSIFSYVTDCNWKAFPLSELIRLVNSFLFIDESSLIAVPLKYLLSLFGSTFNLLSFGFRIQCTIFHISLPFLKDNFFFFFFFFFITLVLFICIFNLIYFRYL